MVLVTIIVWFLLVIPMLIINKKICDRNKKFDNNFKREF